MGFFESISRNMVFLSAILAYAIASFLKVAVRFIKTRKLQLSLFISTGDMPSSHSAFITAAATSVGLTEGFDSAIFALSAAISIVIMYDAQGVRRAAGKQAAAINRIIANFKQLDKILEKELKELLGHTPFEVFAGAGVGIITAWLLNM
ncbi:MAG: divergent PAP2 family protein [Defluviitaleaceae bacterium]|nr:divergent PAP2 family protein [Defluviitaleaceae bacterium]MCL2836759.1 divergent PAP2 family protein [Defluviitaleaceae bacterium]